MVDLKIVNEPKYGVAEAAKRVGISRTTLWREVKSGRIGYYLIRGRRLYGEHHIEAYLRQVDRPSRGHKREPSNLRDSGELHSLGVASAAGSQR